MSIIMMFIPNLWEFITLILWMHVSRLIAYLLQWNPKLSLLQIDAFQIYPWSCEKCFQFWVTFVPTVVLAYIWNPMFVLWGFICAMCLAYSVHKSSSSL